MHKALNEVLASLPDDTKVYVRKSPSLCQSTCTAQMAKRSRLMALPARSRIHKRQHQVRRHGNAKRRDQAPQGLYNGQQADAGQVHHRRRKGASTFLLYPYHFRTDPRSPSLLKMTKVMMITRVETQRLYAIRRKTPNTNTRG